MRTRKPLAQLTLLALTLIVPCLRLAAQTTEIEIKARLIGKPLYLRGFWLEDQLKFDADGRPTGNLQSGTFTEAGIVVHNVKLSHGQLRIEGQRVGLEFFSAALNSPSVAPKRVSLSGPNYTGSISIEIQSPPDGDFSKALDAIFAPDLASLVPAVPWYWQDYAQKHFLDQGSKDNSKPQVAAEKDPPTNMGDKPSHVGGSTTKPVVLHQNEPGFSDAARLLKFSGMVTVYLWVMPDGSVAHLSIVKPAGLGLDEQALYAVSKYKFKPATKDGKPVTVDLYVDVNFQILDGR